MAQAKIDKFEVFYSEKFIDFCFRSYKDMLPAQQWLSELIKRV